MNFSSFLRFLGVVSLVTLVSCDKDFTNVGIDLVGEDHYGLDQTYFDVMAYNQNTGAVQANDMAVNSLGYYNNPVFGKTKASIVTQLELAATNPIFYANDITIDSVYMHVPYFATLTDVDETTGDPIYRLDSILPAHQAGATLPKIKLSVYESGYAIQDFDPSSGLQQPQYYYSNQLAEFEGNLANGGQRINTDNTNADTPATTDFSQNDQFVFRDKELKIVRPSGTVKERLAPGIYLNLNKTFFENKIINAPSGVLLNNNTFRNYFRGLLFKAEAASGFENQGAMARLNFSRGTITILYKDFASSSGTEKVRKKMVLNFGPRTINFFETDYVNPISTPDVVNGDQRLYLKGGQGSMAVLNLFNPTDNISFDVNGNEVNTPNGISDELDRLRNPADGKKWLVNEANLVFHIDKDQMQLPTDINGKKAPEPNRILLYDLNNNRPLVDYSADLSTSASVKNNKFVHGGIISKDSDGRGEFYKIRLTRHIQNLIYNDSTNVRLGLVVTENINNVNRAFLRNPFSFANRINKYIPAMAVVNPLGTILYGGHPNVPENKRIRLQVYYTKPD
ncbi:DUF4270 domain-containing protein [Flavobacterium sp.]|uniref:DUF4270 domain-containing protein n=1 Tax=Flavobacterium sp. TaxID=239 RepID=UPI0026357C04|nr:DUF4270 domain-containing protein [Flavobacterium sp.]